MPRISPLAVAIVLLPTTVFAQADVGAARAECEAKLQIPRIAGTGDPVREMQIQNCVNEKLRQQRSQPASSRQRR